MVLFSRVITLFLLILLLCPVGQAALPTTGITDREESLPTPRETDIQAIFAHPDSFEGEEITLKAIVVHATPRDHHFSVTDHAGCIRCHGSRIRTIQVWFPGDIPSPLDSVEITGTVKRIASQGICINATGVRF